MTETETKTKADAVKSQKYKVERHGPDGIDIVRVSAASGDEAVQKAYKTGTVIRGVMPDTSDSDENSLAAERDEETAGIKAAQEKPTAAALKAEAEVALKAAEDTADRKIPPYV